LPEAKTAVSDCPKTPTTPVTPSNPTTTTPVSGMTTVDAASFMKKEGTIAQERKVAFFMVKLKNSVTTFNGVTQSHYAPTAVTKDVIKTEYFHGTHSLNKYFYEASNENVAFKGTIIDWVTYDQDMTGA